MSTAEDRLEKELDVLRTRESSNTQMFDKAILTLSSAGLGFSLAFIKNIVSLDKTISVWGLNTATLLYVSWLLFATAIATTLYSFLVSLRELQKQSEQVNSELAGQSEFCAESNDDPTERLAYVSFGCYIEAVVLTVGFIIINCWSYSN